MNPCGRPVVKKPGDDSVPCGTKLWWGVGTAKKELEIALCPACIQKQKDEERTLEEATKPV